MVKLLFEVLNAQLIRAYSKYEIQCKVGEMRKRVGGTSGTWRRTWRRLFLQSSITVDMLKGLP
jgi:hypothetical protein